LIHSSVKICKATHRGLLQEWKKYDNQKRTNYSLRFKYATLAIHASKIPRRCYAMQKKQREKKRKTLPNAMQQNITAKVLKTTKSLFQPVNVALCSLSTTPRAHGRLRLGLIFSFLFQGSSGKTHPLAFRANLFSCS